MYCPQSCYFRFLRLQYTRLLLPIPLTVFSPRERPGERNAWICWVTAGERSPSTCLICSIPRLVPPGINLLCSVFIKSPVGAVCGRSATSPAASHDTTYILIYSAAYLLSQNNNLTSVQRIC